MFSKRGYMLSRLGSGGAFETLRPRLGIVGVVTVSRLAPRAGVWEIFPQRYSGAKLSKVAILGIPLWVELRNACQSLQTCRSRPCESKKHLVGLAAQRVREIHATKV